MCRLFDIVQRHRPKQRRPRPAQDKKRSEGQKTNWTQQTMGNQGPLLDNRMKSSKMLEIFYFTIMPLQQERNPCNLDE